MELLNIQKDLSEVNFTAIDFETANECRDSVCSLGLVRVRLGSVVEEKRFLVKPKEMRFTFTNKHIHGIEEKDVINAPEFDEVWNLIFPELNHELLLAHNVAFDKDVLNQTLASYNLKPTRNKYLCTQKLAQVIYPELENYRLPDVAAFLDIPLTHHDCVSDARVAAEIGIRSIPYLNHSLLALEEDELTCYISKKKSSQKVDKFFLKFESKKIDSDVLKPDLQNGDPDSIFFNQRVVFTGDMHGITRQDAASKIQALGADVNTAISKKTNIVIVGNNAGPSKMEKIRQVNSSGGSIRIIYEEEFLSLISMAILNKS